MLALRHLAVMLSLITLFISGCKDSKEEEAIRAVYAAWSDAGNRKDANAFIQRIDPASVARYDSIARLALRGSHRELKALQTNELATVIALRNRLTREEIAALDGNKALRWAIAAGEWSDDDPEDPAIETLSSFQIGDRRAMADLKIEAIRDRFRISFAKGEDGQWRLELDALIDVQSRWLDRLAAKYNKPIEEALLEDEADKSGKAPRKDILDVPPAD